MAAATQSSRTRPSEWPINAILACGGSKDFCGAKIGEHQGRASRMMIFSYMIFTFHQNWMKWENRLNLNLMRKPPKFDGRSWFISHQHFRKCFVWGIPPFSEKPWYTFGGTEHPPCGPLDSNPSISNTPKSENTTSEKGTKGQARGCFYGYFIMVFLPPLEVGSHGVPITGPYIHLWGPSGTTGSPWYSSCWPSVSNWSRSSVLLAAWRRSHMLFQREALLERPTRRATPRTAELGTSKPQSFWRLLGKSHRFS